MIADEDAGAAEAHGEPQRSEASRLLAAIEERDRKIQAAKDLCARLRAEVAEAERGAAVMLEERARAALQLQKLLEGYVSQGASGPPDARQRRTFVPTSGFLAPGIRKEVVSALVGLGELGPDDFATAMRSSGYSEKSVSSVSFQYRAYLIRLGWSREQRSRTAHGGTSVHLIRPELPPRPSVHDAPHVVRFWNGVASSWGQQPTREGPKP